MKLCRMASAAVTTETVWLSRRGLREPLGTRQLRQGKELARSLTRRLEAVRDRDRPTITTTATTTETSSSTSTASKEIQKESTKARVRVRVRTRTRTRAKTSSARRSVAVRGNLITKSSFR